MDSSALLAIILGEPEAARFAATIARAEAPRIPAPSWVEVAIVLEARGDEVAKERFLAYLREGHVRVGSFDEAHAMEAQSAFSRFGKGVHRASLNFGDCMSYGFAKVEGEPLLFKGNDFPQTDIEPALKA